MQVKIPSSALYYTRHLEGSPVTISVFPGEVSAFTTSIAGDGLMGCVAMEEVREFCACWPLLRCVRGC